MDRLHIAKVSAQIHTAPAIPRALRSAAGLVQVALDTGNPKLFAKVSDGFTFFQAVTPSRYHDVIEEMRVAVDVEWTRRVAIANAHMRATMR